MKVTGLAGGIGAAKFLTGLVRSMPPEDLTVIVNTADDILLHGLHISPDLDTIMYTLAGVAHPSQGWGRNGESWKCAEAMRRYQMETWFQLGDQDLATHLYRTERLRSGADLATITKEMCDYWGITSRILPMSNDQVTNRILIANEGKKTDIHFQEYLIKRKGQDKVLGIHYAGIEHAEPLPAALEALQQADTIIFCPSNPIVSIGAILAFPALRDAITSRKVPAIGISPIVQGAPVRGPAAPLMAAKGFPVDTTGVAQAYRGLLDTLIIDETDADAIGRTAQAGDMAVITAPTLMTTPQVATNLARILISTIQP